MTNNFKSMLKFVEFCASPWTISTAFWLCVLLITVICMSGCGTQNNYKLPPWEVKRVELTCDRKTTGLPHGLVCVCQQFGSTWDCKVARIES